MDAYIAESERLWLQILSVDHLYDFQSMMNDPRSNMWSISEDGKRALTEEKAIEFIQDNRPTTEKPWNRRWAIILRPPPNSSSNEKTLQQNGGYVEQSLKPRMIGVVGIPRVAEIAYKLDPEFWGKGYMTEALGLAINLFWKSEEDKKHDRLSAAADPENLASTRVLEKLGFQKGEFKKDFYEREVEGKLTKKHMQCFYLERPEVLSFGKNSQNSGE